ncbi:hypothetical protein MN608_08699 [Microdochium nivale]|nr:hypothetical protein MN608_08699 [Microdochium nivale]
MVKRRVKHKKKTSSRAAEPKNREPIVSSKKLGEPLVPPKETTPPPPLPPTILLTDLPVEIRLAIYELYMLDYIKTSSDALTKGQLWGDIAFLPYPSIFQHERCIGFESAQKDEAPPLLFVCKQVTAEFTPVMRQFVSFVLHSYRCDQQGEPIDSELSLSHLRLTDRNRPPGGRRPRKLPELSFPRRCGPSPKSAIRHLHIQWYGMALNWSDYQTREDNSYLLTIISLLRGKPRIREVPPNTTITPSGMAACSSSPVFMDLSEEPGPGVVMAQLTTLRFTLGFGTDARPTRLAPGNYASGGGRHDLDTPGREKRLASLIIAVEAFREFCPNLRTVELVGIYKKVYMDHFEARARAVGVRLVRGSSDCEILRIMGFEDCE